MRGKTMIKTVTAVVTLLTLSFVLTTTGVSANQYAVKDLLRPCQEGDNDSRNGVIDEMECEQYIKGVLDTIGLTRNLEKNNICLPESAQRPSEVRRAFVKWVFDNFEQRTEPAAKGVFRSLQAAYPCE